MLFVRSQNLLNTLQTQHNKINKHVNTEPSRKDAYSSPGINYVD